MGATSSASSCRAPHPKAPGNWPSVCSRCSLSIRSIWATTISPCPSAPGPPLSPNMRMAPAASSNRPIRPCCTPRQLARAGWWWRADSLLPLLLPTLLGPKHLGEKALFPALCRLAVQAVAELLDELALLGGEGFGNRHPEMQVEIATAAA